MIFNKQIGVINKFEANFFSLLKRTFDTYGFEIEEDIRDNQLYDKGIDGTGERITNKITGRSVYARFTIKLKSEKNQPTDRITLKDTGSFHRSIKLTAFSDHFEISSTDSKAPDLIETYGEDILKPTTDNMRNFIENNVIPDLKKFFR